MPDLAKPLRISLTGNLHSPDMGIVIESLGLERVKSRIQ